MSSKTRTHKTRTTASTTAPAPTLRSVPEQTVAAKVRTDTEDKLWEALHAAPKGAGDPVERTDTTPTETAAEDAQDPVETEAADLVKAEPVVAEVTEPAADGAATDVDKPTEDGADATSEKKARLAPGGLRG